MIKEKLNLKESFEKFAKHGAGAEELLQSLAVATKKANSQEEFKYPFAFGMLSMAVKQFLYIHANMKWDEIDKAIIAESVKP